MSGGRPRRRSHARVRRRHVRIVVSRLQRMVAAGIPPGEALALGAGATGAVAAAFTRVSAAVARGRPLSASLAAAALPLSEADLALVVAGERSGDLARSLGLLDQRLSQRENDRHRLLQALLYPSILITGTALVTSAMAVFVLPSFATMYDELGAELPATTRTVIATGGWLAAHGPATAGTTAIAAIALLWARRRSTGLRRALDRAALATPWIGRLMHTTERARLYATMAVLLQAGLDVERALALAAPAVATTVVRERCARVGRLLRSGTRLSLAIDRSGLDLDGGDSGLLRVAEATGDYATCLQQLSAVAAEERDLAVAGLARVAEPAAVAIVALAVGATVLAVYQPVLGSAALLAGGPS